MITADIETLEVFYAHTISPICIAVIVSTVVLGFVWRFAHGLLALTALMGYLLIGIVVPLISSARLKEAGVRYRSEFAAFNAYFLDSIKGVKDIVLHNAGAERREEVDCRTERLLEESRKMKRESSKATAFTEMTVSLVILSALAVGMGLVRGGSITVGRMLVGITVVFGSFGPVIAVSALPGNLTQTFASGERVLSLLEERPAVETVKNGAVIDYEELRVEELTFGYDRERVLRDICLYARKGEIIGIIGESGCGKSTLLKLLLRFWEKDGGTIAYNGVDIDDIDGESLLRNVTMVSQNTYLFDETIEENLRIAKPDATEEELVEACKMASVYELIRTLPEGFQIRVGAMGDALSAGEKQRLGLARAFLSGAELILLDGPTSNVDSINEGVILRSLRQQKNKKSMILVSHRPSTMAIADRIYSMKDGRLSQ